MKNWNPEQNIRSDLCF